MDTHYNPEDIALLVEHMCKSKDLSPLMQHMLSSIKGSTEKVIVPSSHMKEMKEKSNARCTSSTYPLLETPTYDQIFRVPTLKRNRDVDKVYGKELLSKHFKEQHVIMCTNRRLVRSWFDNVNVDLRNNTKGQDEIKGVISRNLHQIVPLKFPGASYIWKDQDIYQWVLMWMQGKRKYEKKQKMTTSPSTPAPNEMDNDTLTHTIHIEDVAGSFVNQDGSFVNQEMQNESIHMEADHDNIRDIVEPPYMEKNNDMLIHTGHDSNVDGYFVNQEMHNDSVHMEDHDNIRDVDAFHMDKDNDILTHIDHERDVDDYYASVENGTQFPSCESFLQLLQGVGSNVIAPEDAPCMQSQMSQQPMKNQKQQSVEFVTRDNVRKSQRPRKVNMRLKRVIGDDHMENEESHIGASKAKRKFKDLHQLEAPKLKSKHFAQPIKAGGWSVVNQETIVMKFIGAKTIDHMYSQLKNVWNYVKNKIKKPNALGSDKDYHCMREGVVEWLLQEGKITIKNHVASTLHLDDVEVA